MVKLIISNPSPTLPDHAKGWLKFFLEKCYYQNLSNASTSGRKILPMYPTEGVLEVISRVVIAAPWLTIEVYSMECTMRDSMEDLTAH